MGIIDSLSAGFRFLVHRPALLIIPLLLDLWLWFMPPLSIAPLLDRLAGFYLQATDVEGFPPELVDMSDQVSEAIALLSDTSNLWTLLANTWLMHMPSMMATLGVMPSASPIVIDNLLAVGGLVLILSLVGIFIGTIFLELAARNLPIGGSEKAESWRQFADNLVRHFGRIVLLVLIAGLGMLAAYVPLSFAVGMAALLSPALSSMLFVLLAGLTLVIFFYLYFVVAAIVMDDLSTFGAVRQSVRLVRANFMTTLGFVFLTSFITIGFTLILAPLAENEPVGTAIAIIGNSFLGAGLAIAYFVFYRTHVLRMAEETPPLDGHL